MWSKIGRQEAREAELAINNAWFKPILDKGARLSRHNNDVQSAQAIIYSIIENQPRTLRIQHELVDLGKDISQTAAGEELNRMLRRKDRAAYICEICGASFTAKHNLRSESFISAHPSSDLLAYRSSQCSQLELAQECRRLALYYVYLFECGLHWRIYATVAL
jgi:hypothetical protein